MNIYHATQYRNGVFSKTACGLETWQAGTMTTNRDLVTCVKCVEVLPVKFEVPVESPVAPMSKTKKPKPETLQGSLL